MADEQEPSGGWLPRAATYDELVEMWQKDQHLMRAMDQEVQRLRGVLRETREELSATREQREDYGQQLAEARTLEQDLRSDLHGKDKVIAYWKDDDAKVRAERDQAQNDVSYWKRAYEERLDGLMQSNSNLAKAFKAGQEKLTRMRALLEYFLEATTGMEEILTVDGRFYETRQEARALLAESEASGG